MVFGTTGSAKCFELLSNSSLSLHRYVTWAVDTPVSFDCSIVEQICSFTALPPPPPLSARGTTRNGRPGWLSMFRLLPVMYGQATGRLRDARMEDGTRRDRKCLARADKGPEERHPVAWQSHGLYEIHSIKNEGQGKVARQRWCRKGRKRGPSDEMTQPKANEKIKVAPEINISTKPFTSY